MAYTIRSRDLAGNANQSKIFDTDIRILTDGLAGVGVVSNCAVTAQGSPDMTVAIAAGTIRIADGTLVAVTSGNGTIGTADATNPRIDLISASNAGTKTVTAGTAAANPKPPDLPSGNVALAMVYVAANDTAISSGEITDKRVLLDSATRLSRGTAFPASPATDDHFVRTNINNMEFFYDGTRWRSVQVFSFAIQVKEGLYGIDTPSTGETVAEEIGWAGIPWAGTYDIWALDLRAVALVSGTNNGSNYWTITNYKRTPGQSATSLGSFNTSADTVGNGVAHSITINAAIISGNSTHTYVAINGAKTAGAPGALFISAQLLYQIIAT